MPRRAGRLIDALEGAAVGVEGVQVSGLREEHVREVVQHLDLGFAIEGLAGEREGLLEVALRGRVVTAVVLGETDAVHRAALARLVARRAERLGRFAASPGGTVVFSLRRRHLAEGDERGPEISEVAAGPEVGHQRFVELLRLAQRALLLQRARFAQALLETVPGSRRRLRLGETERREEGRERPGPCAARARQVADGIQRNARDAGIGSTVPAASSPRSPSICTGELDRTTRDPSAGIDWPAKSSDASRVIRVLAGSVKVAVAMDPAEVERSSMVVSAASAAGFCRASPKNWPGAVDGVKKAPVNVWGEKIGSVRASRVRALRPSHAARR